MGSFLALILIILVAWFLVRLGTSALQLTGMSHPSAQFQAASAFFGVGFTTKEAEQVVNHPVRRRIVLHLIVAGNIGLTSALATLLVTFMNGGQAGWGSTFAWLGLVLACVIIIAFILNLRVVSVPIERVMQWSLRQAGMKRVRNYDHLLNITDGFCLEDYEVDERHPWVGKSLAQTRPADVGVIVLGIYRGTNTFIGAPDKDVRIQAGDVVLVYGRGEDLRLRLANVKAS